MLKNTYDHVYAASGVTESNPKRYFVSPEQCSKAIDHLNNNDFRSAIIDGFNLSLSDSYVYHAIASVTLAQVQSAIEAGTENGLCDWYPDEQGHTTGYHPPAADVTAYASMFLPTTANSANALRGFGANAKKGSIRASIAEHLVAKRWMSSTFPTIPKPSKSKKHLFNPYLEFWIWSCHALHWAGPGPNTADIQMSHAVLPIFMHHFGCVVPSREALEAIKLVAGIPVPDTILDLGSGNGYWTYMLRANKLPVIAIDNQQSVFRCNWIGDTVIKDGAQFLNSRDDGIKDVLLLVYPVVGADFFRSMLDAYKGSKILVAGTQCQNGYTAFKDTLVDEWMAKEKPNWTLEFRIPLPSFPGKDEALYYFRRHE